MTRPTIRRVLVVGAGTMGCQIAMECASHGFEVTVVDPLPAALQRAPQTLAALAEARAADQTRVADPEQIVLTDDLAAGADADLVCESVPEDPAIKAEVFAALDQICPAHTIVTTNTSTLLPSSFAEATGRSDRFAALHFHLPTWRSNLADVMPHGHPELAPTSEQTLTTLTAFAEAIGQVPIRLNRESAGYLFNAMYSALNGAAITLAANEVASIDDIDLAWSTVMKTAGPFRMLDHVGIDTVWQISEHWANATGQPQQRRNADWLRGYVDRGWLGVKTGRGFHDHSLPDTPAPATE